MRLAAAAAAVGFLALLVNGCAASGSGGVVRSFAATPDVTIRESRTHYSVRGSGAREIGAALAENSPRMDGRPALGLTRWSLTWDFDLRRSAGTCRVVAPEVDAELEIVLPRWVGGPPADAPLVSRWEAFVEALVEHEEGHRRLVLEASREIAHRLRRTGGPSCALARRRADRAARRIVEDYHGRNRAYDLETRGGRTQGVRWP